MLPVKKWQRLSRSKPTLKSEPTSKQYIHRQKRATPRLACSFLCFLVLTQGQHFFHDSTQQNVFKNLTHLVSVFGSRFCLKSVESVDFFLAFFFLDGTACEATSTWAGTLIMVIETLHLIIQRIQVYLWNLYLIPENLLKPPSNPKLSTKKWDCVICSVW